MFFWGVLGIVAWIIIAFWPARWAQKKGYSFLLFLILSWFISFLLTLLIVAFLKDKTKTAQDRADDQAVEAVLEKEAEQV